MYDTMAVVRMTIHPFSMGRLGRGGRVRACGKGVHREGERVKQRSGVCMCAARARAAGGRGFTYSGWARGQGTCVRVSKHTQPPPVRESQQAHTAAAHA